MAYEILFDAPQVSGVIGLDVSTQEPDNADTLKVKSVSMGQKKSNGRETVEHMALIVALTLGVLWFFGTTLLKDARL